MRNDARVIIYATTDEFYAGVLWFYNAGMNFKAYHLNLEINLT
tara:strand:+ start:1193 stop:1321 length:129 start_codon:yes stop_codon:yes gene_type:complete